MDAAVRNQGALIKTLEIQIGQISNVLQEIGFGSLPSFTEANPRDHVKSISTTIETDTNLIRRIGQSQYAVSTSQNSKQMYETRQTTIPFPSHLNDYYCEKEKGKYGPQFMEALTLKLHILIIPYPKRRKTQGVLLYLALLIMFALIMPFLRERMELDLEARLMGETLMINRSLDPLNGDYIELNDLNEPFELRRNQGDDLMPTIEECEFHNSIMKDKMVYKGNNVIGALMNVPIFVGTFSVVTDFVVLEDMDAYRDEGMGDDLNERKEIDELVEISTSLEVLES
ncbi:hypothetical protein Tco_0929538 [Tanacetum coccineum]